MDSLLIDNQVVEAITLEAEHSLDNTLELLETIVNIDSYSVDKNGVESVFPLLTSQLISLGFAVEYISQKKFADQIRATHGTDDTKKNILITGHIDTVFPPGTTQERPFACQGNHAYGPGVADMKGGIAITLSALKILKKLNLLNMPIEVLLTGDEELGSPVSAPILDESAKHAAVCFAMEPGRADGSVVTSRKGSGQGRMEIKGVASHSGVDFDKGVSANLELAYKMLFLNALNDSKKGTTINCGVVSGGISSNMVSPAASLDIHFSYKTVPCGEELIDKIQDIANKSFQEGTTTDIEIRLGCLPMEDNEGNKNLFFLVKDCAANLGKQLRGTNTNGASDAGRTSVAGVPTICAMGPVGGNYHTKDEYIEVDSIAFRTSLLALSILAASQRYQQSN